MMTHKSSIASCVLFLAHGAFAESYCADKRSDCPQKAAVPKWCTEDPWAVATCPVSCGWCGDEEDSTIPKANCKDTDVHCAWWAQSGECHTNRERMLHACPTSCGLCTPICPRDQALCKHWAEFGECDSNPLFAVPTCPRACGACREVCKDKSEHCSSWAEMGECSANKDAMLNECAMSCGLCATSEAEGDFGYCADITNSSICKQMLEEDTDACNLSEMMEGCASTCGLCSHACMDHDHRCGAWVKEGRCQNKEAMVMKACPSSCGLCHMFELDWNDEPCVDDEECAQWAREGQCHTNQGYMAAKCPIACGFCHEPGHPHVEVAREIKHDRNRNVPTTPTAKPKSVRDYYPDGVGVDDDDDNHGNEL